MDTPDPDLHSVIKALPELPGVYQFLDQNGVIIYVGKAKSLKKRVSSYFQKDHDYAKVRIMVKRIKAIQTIVVDTELDALLLENSLIKKYKPRYNVMLKDDKTFPWICIKKERFPRVFSTRRKIKDGSEYIGPFASVIAMKTILELLRETFKLRSCNFDLSENKINKKLYRECLDFHIGKCKAPCTARQSEADYNQTIAEIKYILKGNISSVIRDLKEKIKIHAENLAFEQAQELKIKLDNLERYQARSTVVSPMINNVDVFALVSDSETAYVNYFRVMNGAIVMGQTLEMKKNMEITDNELLEFSIAELRSRYQSEATELLVPFEPEIKLPDISYVVPKTGDKKKLLDLSLANAENYRREKQKQIAITDPDRHVSRIMTQMQKDLKLTEEPRRIECFDNSNIQGAFAVSSMTVFIDGKPAKKEYRHFNIKSVDGPDDFASMEEVIYRRYKRVTEEELPLPQLIVIDGGKGQLSAAVKSLDKLGLIGKVAVIGIAKKLEEIYFPGDSIPLYLDKRSETLKIIQHIRNEAHRFGITHHRNKRSRETIKTELNLIPGISEKSAEKLLIAFRSVEQIKKAELAALSAAVGQAKAKLVFNFFHRETDNNQQVM